MTKLVGILNITPDSFSDGGLYNTPDSALLQAKRLFNEGANLIDIGAESTRPGALALSWQEEWRRLKPILPILLQLYPTKVSLDTYHPETAERALALGDVIINDVTGIQNPLMRIVVVKNQARCIISHLPAADTVTAHKQNPLDDPSVVVRDLLATQAELMVMGLSKDKCILDPGIGFGKSQKLNWQLLKFAQYVPGASVMIGYSRKRFLGEQRMELAPNLAAADIAVNSGATYLRVHDVAGHMHHITK